MKRDSYSNQQSHASFQPRSPQSAIDSTQLGQPTQHSSSTSDVGAKWLNKASSWMADKLQIAQNFVSSEDAILQGRGYANAPDQILPALKGTASPNQPLVGVIDSGFGANEHGCKMVEAIQKENPQAQIWQGDGVGTGNWSESLVEFVDTAKAGGHSRAVANLSFDLTEVHPDGSVSTRTQLTTEEQSALAYARDNGVLVVASSGNQGGAMSALGQASQPSDNLIVVGAANGSDRAAYSSYGNGLDLVADVGSAGTSAAAANVTGAIANIWSANPELTSQQVNQILTTTATDLNTPGRDAETGAGLLNSTGAIDLATHTTPEAIVFSGAQLIQPVPESLAGAAWESRNGALASERTNFPIEGAKLRSPARSIPAQRAAKQRAAGQNAFALHRQGERAPLPNRPPRFTPTPAQQAARQRAVAPPTPAQQANILHRQGERSPLPDRPARSTPTPAQRAAGQRAVGQRANKLHRQGERASLNRPPQSNQGIADRYTVELKAWIPHSKVVDPMSAINEFRDVDLISTVGDFGGYNSYFRGDNHKGYNGSHRVVSRIEFNYDGHRITGLTHKEDYGQTHRDWSWKRPLVGVQALFPSRSGTETKQADEATFGKVTGSNSFSLGIHSQNPLVPLSPAIDSNLSGSFKPGSQQLVLSYDTDLFPSHGFQVSKNGKVVATEVVNDVSGVEALGARGAINLGTRLSLHTNEGTEIIPIYP